jgi:hypothetical protein
MIFYCGAKIDIATLVTPGYAVSKYFELADRAARNTFGSFYVYVGF